MGYYINYDYRKLNNSSVNAIYPKYNEIDKTELLIGQAIPYDIVDKRGVLLVKAGKPLTEELKRKLFKWGKIFRK